MVLIPFGTSWLAMSAEQFQEALERGRSLVPSPTRIEATRQEADRVLDAEGMQRQTGIPASWFLEQARKGAIPSLHAGKYRRFVVREVLEAIAARRPTTEATRVEPGRERRRPQPEITRNARGGSA